MRGRAGVVGICVESLIGGSWSLLSSSSAAALAAASAVAPRAVSSFRAKLGRLAWDLFLLAILESLSFGAIVHVYGSGKNSLLTFL